MHDDGCPGPEGLDLEYAPQHAFHCLTFVDSFGRASIVVHPME